MITKDQAMTETLFHQDCTAEVGPRGGLTHHPVIVRRNGQTQTWKTMPERFRVPVKYGLYQYGEIASWNADAFNVPAACPVCTAVAAYHETKDLAALRMRLDAARIEKQTRHLQALREITAEANQAADEARL